MGITATGHTYLDSESGATIDAWFPGGEFEPARSCLAEQAGIIRGETVTVTIDAVSEPAESAADAYLRLHLISRRACKPNEINLEGVFGLLSNVAWTSAGPVIPAKVDALRAAAAARGHDLHVTSVDKFPRMADYVIPDAVRIADADRVRLGAHLAEGTTVMHEGFVNFNAGTLGPSMVEGRISAGVVVGANSDLGGSASIMGTLSGGGTEVIRVGENCLIGANAGIGISLGDRCTVEAGLYVTGGTKVTLPDGTVRRGRELSGSSDLLYRRNSQTGAVEVVPSDGSRWVGLNTELHANQ
ncbi:MAG: tetrahydrodipicolinate succinyltransferase [Acidimicrobiia bacterium]|nr:tetrahydrodipicolinate succinyltransferase [Acidimicrobiia bacterium]